MRYWLALLLLSPLFGSPSLTEYTTMSETTSWQYHYNIGTLYLQDNQLGRALGHLIQAKHNAPRVPEIRQNTLLARRNQTDQLLQPTTTNPLIHLIELLAFREWLLIIGIVITLMHLTLTYRHRLPNPPLILQLLSIPLIISFISLSYMTLTRQPTKAAIIVEQKVGIRQGPSDVFDPLFFLHDGLQVTQLSTHNGWAKIKLANGVIGWVPTDSIWLYLAS